MLSHIRLMKLPLFDRLQCQKVTLRHYLVVLPHNNGADNLTGLDGSLDVLVQTQARFHLFAGATRYSHHQILGKACCQCIALALPDPEGFSAPHHRA